MQALASGRSNKRKLDKMQEVAPADRKRIMRLAPYLKRYKANPPR